MRLGRAFALIVAAVLVTGCSGGGNGTTQPTVPVVVELTTTTVAAPPTTVVPDIQYTVQAGDSLFRIAANFCTIAAEVVATNGWTDGTGHPLFPGDVILIPGPGCPVITEPPTTLPPNKYLALYLDERVITDPFDQNTIDYVSWGPVCYSAYWTAHAYAVQGGTKAHLLEALAAIGTVTPELMVQINRWEVFSQTWYPVYVDVRGRIAALYPMYPDIDAFYRVLFNDPEYVELLDAYDAEGDNAQYAAKYWVIDVCNARFRTTGSTP